MFIWYCKILEPLLSIVLVNYLFRLCIAEFIHVYPENEFQGGELKVAISGCLNLPKPWTRKVSSVNTKDQCARLYDDTNCSGNHIEILKRSPSHNILSGWNFDDKTVSTGPCLNSCSTEITGRLFDEVVIVNIFSKEDFKGSNFTITLHGCVSVAAGFVDNILSVDTHGHCVQLYNNADCKINTIGGDTIELRRGTPAHNDLKTWSFTHTKAISHCNYKCASSNRFRLPLEGEIFLFYSKFYGGNFMQINGTYKDCITTDNRLYGSLESIKLGRNSGLTLFSRRKCKGLEYVVKTSIPELTTLNLKWSPLSFKGLCI